MPKSYVPVQAVAGQLDCHTGTVWRKARIEPGFPKPVRLGGLTRWVQEEIDAYLAKAEAEREAA